MSWRAAYKELAGSIPYYDPYFSGDGYDEDGRGEETDPVKYDPDRRGGYRCPVGFGTFKKCGGPAIRDAPGTVVCGNCHMWLENHKPIPL